MMRSPFEGDDLRSPWPARFGARLSASTLKSYRSDWRRFEQWCTANGHTHLPASKETVLDYVDALSKKKIAGRHGRPATHKPATIERIMVTISTAHALAGIESPVVGTSGKFRKKLRRKLRAEGRQLAPAVAEVVLAMVNAIRKRVSDYKCGLTPTRDVAVLLVGFHGAFRRSEIVSLNIEDVEFDESGTSILLRRSKNDQTGKGRIVRLVRREILDECPVVSLEKLVKELASAGYENGPLVLALDRSRRRKQVRADASIVSTIVRSAALKAGLVGDFGSHSLRAGFVTSSVRSGASISGILETTGHKSAEGLAGYIRCEAPVPVDLVRCVERLTGSKTWCRNKLEENSRPMNYSELFETKSAFVCQHCLDGLRRSLERLS